MKPSDAKLQPASNGIPRRKFLRDCALGTLALASAPILGCREMDRTTPRHSGPASWTYDLNEKWLFGGELDSADVAKTLDDAMFSPITLPHCVSKLSWRNWMPSDWEKMWIYRRHFILPEKHQGARVFLDFSGVMVAAKPTINDYALPEHQGGYLPFQYEITDWLRKRNNMLTLIVDSRWQDVPPEGSLSGPNSIDYLEPGGIHRPVKLQIVPPIFISDVFAKPVNVLDARRRIEVTGTIDAAVAPQVPMHIKLELSDGSHIIATAQQEITLRSVGETEFKLTLSHLGNIKLWDVDKPHLYELVTTLFLDGVAAHNYRMRIGLREARFDVTGFYLNGRRLQLFGLNRHELFPYAGFAMPPRVMRRDAEILKHEFNCNIVRCSHYPQSSAFLDACDELGLLVWEETPGWQFIGGPAWQELVIRNVQDMVRRDRNHPSIIIWGVRVNESANNPSLYEQTKAAAKALDDSRSTSGSMTPNSKQNWQRDWHQDVFAFDDYHSAPDGSVGINTPLPGVPYMLAEAVGQFKYGTQNKFTNCYRRAGNLTLQTQQALFHAQAHNKAAMYPRMAGVIAWCAYDYGSLINANETVKCPGVADVFRISKLGAVFYQSQVSPQVCPVILPNFYWDFGPRSPRGPGKKAAIFSNCDWLDIFISEKQIARLHPDHRNFSHLKYPPYFCDLEMSGVSNPELRIDGYVNHELVLSKTFSSDSTQDHLFLAADDSVLTGDGVDATRIIFKVTDKYGAERAFATGIVTFEVNGPALIIGDDPFDLKNSGGVGAVWARTKSNSSGQITVRATHSTLGEKSLNLLVIPNPETELV